MKLHLTFNFDEKDRRAISARNKGKKPATRTQVIQWLCTLVAEHRGELLARAELIDSHDPNQALLPFGGPSGQEGAETPSAATG